MFQSYYSAVCSQHSLRPPHFLSTIVTRAAQGLVDSLMIPVFNGFSICSSHLSTHESAILYDFNDTGW